MSKERLCPHGRRASQCKECGAVGFCEHGRRRNTCKECGGASICVHGRFRQYCKECGGSSICVHGRRRGICKECGGSGICVHQRQRSHCKECGEHSIFKKGGFSKEETQQLGAVKRCQFPGCGVYSESLHSDHDHSCCPLKKLCTECYRGELCANHNMWMGTFDAHPEWAAADVREYLSRRPYARNPRFLLMSNPNPKGRTNDSQL